MSGSDKKVTGIRRLFREHRVVEREQLQEVLGSKSRMTLYRYLSQFEYLSSCSDRGSYYTLGRYPEFDSHGLWRWGDVVFSRFGTLRKTLVWLVNESPSGYYQGELRRIVGLKVQDSLLVLINAEQLSRELSGNKFLYINIDKEKGAQQLAKRQEMMLKQVKDSIPTGLVIEVLVEIIRVHGVVRLVDPGFVVVGLQDRGVLVSPLQVSYVLEKYGLKKTAD